MLLSSGRLGPVHAMAELLARYAGGTVHTVDVGASSARNEAATSARLRTDSKHCLVIASDPGQLYAKFRSVLRVPPLRRDLTG